ncbi:methylated-DNA--[protein]-cysteine S-methyltransferase [Sedimentisphaera salicampi]|uniref:Methylated-DNA--protein-cysteine methyltransferase, constitutive n=1 Tax=Sedimentisphaera salicampi TaxID=1941349 RepID=A0A1W6LJS6_9BACT|nr:methylated-DNA--[protein]-cysteine S-methyltransferase [Sedimentisphaera salicampi]ARN56048.1 Methylated-DNA--protein-cysteine methyltransferase, constitutive [Sedimentisphaera salicampi]OXU15781.1 Methylated-DNA--protein-cysteine methyltransferase, constitutive [Sedimentisphaera salicampi]
MQKMPENKFEHQVFKTELGWAGIVESAGIICRVILPADSKEDVLSITERYSSSYKVPGYAAEKIILYFQGRQVDFSDLKIKLNAEGFSKDILKAAARIKYGSICTYADLADKAGQKGKARPAGRALANNPLPVIIPCHRVIKKDGSLGGFMGSSGNLLKLRMLRLEGVSV